MNTLKGASDFLTWFFLKISLNTDDMLAKMSDTNILYIDHIVGNQPDLCMEVSPRFLLCELLKK